MKCVHEGSDDADIVVLQEVTAGKRLNMCARFGQRRAEAVVLFLAINADDRRALESG